MDVVFPTLYGVKLAWRKIIVDTYSGYARQGGGAFSGNEYSKVDINACYIVKNIVAGDLGKKCEIQPPYIINVAEPTSMMGNTSKLALTLVTRHLKRL